RLRDDGPMTSAALPTRSEGAAPAGAATAVRLDAVERHFALAEGRRDVLRGLDVDLGAGEIVAVVGPSGCGKSTLLRLIAGLDTQSGGVITIDGTGVTDTVERTAVSFQEPRQTPSRPTAANVDPGPPPRLPG